MDKTKEDPMRPCSWCGSPVEIKEKNKDHTLITCTSDECNYARLYASIEPMKEIDGL